jgi:excisionase family DNA binding protein
VLEKWCAMVSSDSRDQSFSDQRFLTVAEVASMMRVSKMTVYRLVHSGELPAVRVGRSFRVPEAAVDDYLRKSYFQAG